MPLAGQSAAQREADSARCNVEANQARRIEYDVPKPPTAAERAVMGALIGGAVGAASGAAVGADLGAVPGAAVNGPVGAVGGALSAPPASAPYADVPAGVDVGLVAYRACLEQLGYGRPPLE